VTPGLVLGRPGVYTLPPRVDDGLKPVRLDIAGFVGVALRGPVNSPVPVSSWSDYEFRFGDFTRPDNSPDRLLPYAVQAFFAQGGVRAYIVRVAPPPDFHGPTAEDATTTFTFKSQDEPWRVAAANEGTWGNALTIRLSYEVTQTFRVTVMGPTSLRLPPGVDPPDHSLIRIRTPGASTLGELRALTRLFDPTTDRVGGLDAPLDDSHASLHELEVDVVTATLAVTDASSAVSRKERLSGLGLVPRHARFISKVLLAESLFVRPLDPGATPPYPDHFLSDRIAEMQTLGVDRSYGITGASFFDDGDAADDPLDELTVHRGADAMGRVVDLGIMCVPDLTWSADRPSPAPASGTRAPTRSECDMCGPPEQEPTFAVPVPIPRGLDATRPDDYAKIVERQKRLVQIAVLRRQFVALLDVPRGLPVRGITSWRSNFDSSFAAAYHPWLGVPRRAADGGRSVEVPPSSFAAGIVAERERVLGLPWGPANEIARGAILSAERIGDATHDQLHLLGVNVFRSERDGFRLSAARTLSNDNAYRQLSVRRLMTMLELSLERQTQWLVFEPHTFELRARLRNTVTQFLRTMQRGGAFAGATEQESFFVHCDDDLNPTSSLRQGRLIAEIGVAPASPLEYLVLQVSQDIDGTFSTRDHRG
jgi:uncharacterized protein